jgi:dihydrofolate reductase
MKTILYMAISLDGFIAGPNDDTSWVSPQEYDSFRAKALEVGNAVYGFKTYEIGIKDGIPPLEGAINVVMSRKSHENYGPYIFTKDSPQEVLKFLENKGFEYALICGGGQINSLFSPFLDEICLDIEPVFLKSGISLFGDTIFKNKLKIISTKSLGSETFQIRYQVIK